MPVSAPCTLLSSFVELPDPFLCASLAYLRLLVKPMRSAHERYHDPQFLFA
jgi:hypothetical protein